MSTLKPIAMTQKIISLGKITSVLIVLFSLAGCVKDNCTKTYTYYMPIYRTSAEVRANIKSNPSREIERPGKLLREVPGNENDLCTYRLLSPVRTYNNG